MNIKIPKWLKRLFFPGYLSANSVVDPVFGKLDYYADNHEWRGRVNLMPLEPEQEVVLIGDETGVSNRVRAMFLELQSRWKELKPEVVNSLYEGYKAMVSVISDNEIVDKNRFEQVIEVTRLRIFDRAASQYTPGRTIPDYEISFFGPGCGKQDQCLRIEITNWDVGKAAYLDWRKGGIPSL
ncbi:MAG TPA: hypothetical protein VN300_12320 [Desulfobacterales bacterium]|jgi:hypothetical protein|nr:hypothetical protein [Desulfobacterales bacterium]